MINAHSDGIPDGVLGLLQPAVAFPNAASDILKYPWKTVYEAVMRRKAIADADRNLLFGGVAAGVASGVRVQPASNKATPVKRERGDLRLKVGA